jgi:hypothetical protein
VFPPSLKELPPPSLDLFDLDEQFASEKYYNIYLTIIGSVWLSLRINAQMMTLNITSENAVVY